MGKKLRLYLVKLVGNGEVFLKLGVTTKTVEERINHINGYELEEILIEETLTPLLAYGVEQNVKDISYKKKEIRYKPIINFSGQYECYEDTIESIKEIVKIVKRAKRLEKKLLLEEKNDNEKFLEAQIKYWKKAYNSEVMKGRLWDQYREELEELLKNCNK